MPRLTCACGARYRFDDDAVGKRAKCKKCGTVFTIKADEEDGVIPFAAEPDMMGEIAAAAKRAPSIPATETAGGPRTPETGARTCPSCKKQLPPFAKICVGCGVDLKTGRSLMTSQDSNLDEVYATAETVIRFISWLFWGGIYPIASEAFGTRRPYVIRGFAILTVLFSAWFWAYEWTDSPRMTSLKNLMLWAGDGEPSSTDLYMYYQLTSYGDIDALESKMEELQSTDPDMAEEAALVAAHHVLPKNQRYNGEFSAYQLLTHAFLHADLIHLATNLLFLMVFGSRVNAALGNTMTLVMYPILAIGAGTVHVIAESKHAPFPMLGASGAIMGLAGLYLVLFPLHKVHMAAWMRWGLIRGFHLSLRIWSVRGIWVVLFYIAFDVFYTAIGAEDGVAHWAHLGGFIVGVAVGLALIVSRTVNARGSDLVSALMGRHAWLVVGRPNSNVGILQRLP